MIILKGIQRIRKWESMVFKNPVRPVTIEIVPRGTPCGFSKSRHKKMAKKKQVTKITEEDFTNIGYGLGRMIRVFKDGFDRGIQWIS